MKSTEIEKQVVQHLSKDFYLDNDQFLPLPADTGELKNKLKKIIEHLLQADFERLLNAMYRLDIDETRFKSLLSGVHGNDVSGKLAEIVIERELQKIETRMKFKND